MADFVLKDDQNVDVDVALVDAAGNVVAGADVDAGSLTASFPSGDTNYVVVIADDGSSVNVQSTGELVTGDELTVEGTYNGTAVTAGTLAFDTVADLPVAIGLVPGEPQQNAPVEPSTPPAGG